MDFVKTVEKIVSCIDHTSRKNTFVDRYFDSGLTFDQLVINFTFIDPEDFGKYEKVVRNINRKKSAHIYFENHDRFGACIGIVASEKAEDLEIYLASVKRSSEEFNKERHEFIVNGMPDDKMKEKLDDLHSRNCRRFISELSARRIIQMKKTA